VLPIGKGSIKKFNGLPRVRSFSMKQKGVVKKERFCHEIDVATLLWPSVGVKPNTWKSWDLESSGTLECSELDSKGQNTSH